MPRLTAVLLAPLLALLQPAFALAQSRVADTDVVIAPTRDSNPGAPVQLGTRFCFAATTDAHGRERWCSDGTAGTVQVKDVLPGASSSAPEGLTAVGSTLFFTAADGLNGREVWWAP